MIASIGYAAWASRSNADTTAAIQPCSKPRMLETRRREALRERRLWGFLFEEFLVGFIRPIQKDRSKAVDAHLVVGPTACPPELSGLFDLGRLRFWASAISCPCLQGLLSRRAPEKLGFVQDTDGRHATGMRTKIDLRVASLAGVLLALNIGLAKVAALLTLPLFLDSVGTILAGALLPPWYVVGVAVSTSLLGGLVIHPAYPFYACTQVAIALLALVAFRKGLLRKVWTSLLTGALIGLVAAVVSAPVTAVVFGGVTLGGATAINAVLLAAGQNLWKAVIAGSLFVEMLDKPIAALVAHLALKRLPSRFQETHTSRK